MKFRRLLITFIHRRRCSVVHLLKNNVLSFSYGNNCCNEWMNVLLNETTKFEPNTGRWSVIYRKNCRVSTR